MSVWCFYFIVQSNLFKIDPELLSITLCLRKMCGFVCVGRVVLTTLPGCRNEGKGHSPEERPHLDTQLPSFPSFHFEILNTHLITRTNVNIMKQSGDTQWVNIRKSYWVHCSSSLSVLLSGTILSHSVILFSFLIPCLSLLFLAILQVEKIIRAKLF